jgi:ABC-type glycerol-3-phosphate transport system permease component
LVRNRIATVTAWSRVRQLIHRLAAAYSAWSTAALTISSLIPIVLFLVFQSLFLRGAGLSGAVKG